MDLKATSIIRIDNTSGIVILEMLPFYRLTNNAIKRYEEDLGIYQLLNDNFIRRYKYLSKNGEKEANQLKVMLADNKTY